MEDERGGGASVVEAAQKLGLAAGDHRRGRPLRPPPGRRSRRRIPPRPRLSSRRPSTAMSASTTTRSPSAAAMSGTTCSASRRRASAASTRSRTRSRRAGATTRSATGCAAKADRDGAEARAGRHARRRGRRQAGLKVETATASSATPSPPGLPAGAVTAAFRTAKDGVGQTARRRRQRMDRLPRHRRHRAAGRPEPRRRAQETEGQLCSAG